MVPRTDMQSFGARPEVGLLIRLLHLQNFLVMPRG